MIKIKKVNKNDKKILNNLLQLYLHDISIYFPIDFNSKKGIYEYSTEKYFSKLSNYQAFLFKENENIVGFALIEDDNNTKLVQEMFILNNYKSKGFGAELIIKVFDKFKGNWVIRSLPCSEKSENFWKKTIEKYTNGNYTLEHIGKYNRAVFRFNNKN